MIDIVRRYLTRKDEQKLNKVDNPLNLSENFFWQGVCKEHTGKMEGMWSFSTACTKNRFCAERIKNNESVCSHCFAESQLARQRNTRLKNERNGEYIKNHIMSREEIPFLNVAYFRFESFGDLETAVQVVNYFNVAKCNPHVHFALFTKNLFIIELALDGYHISKPKNMVIVYSSPLLNTVHDVRSRYPFVDKVFTVYDDEYIRTHDVKINCGGRCCATCLRCYKKTTANLISEKLK